LPSGPVGICCKVSIAVVALPRIRYFAIPDSRAAAVFLSRGAYTNFFDVIMESGQSQIQFKTFFRRYNEVCRLSDHLLC
jgi:hypothetical protein